MHIMHVLGRYIMPELMNLARILTKYEATIFLAYMLKILAGNLIFSLFFDKPCKPIPLDDDPIYTSRDVSVVLAVIDPPDTFADTLVNLLQQRPLEIIVVTTARWKEAVIAPINRVKLEMGYHSPEFALITLLVSSVPNHRYQQELGYRNAKGAIILRCDDDILFEHPLAFEYFLAAFGSKNNKQIDQSGKPRAVGGVMGPQGAIIPPQDQWSTEMTPWRALAIASLEANASPTGLIAQRYGADGGVTCLIGRAIFLRASLVTGNPDFSDYFLHERWIGGSSRLNAGDDCLLTRWVRSRGFETVYQAAPEARLRTLTKKSLGDFVGQRIRWRRSGDMHFMKTLFSDRPPTFWLRFREEPYTTTLMIDRLVWKIFNVRILVAWVNCLVKGYSALGNLHNGPWNRSFVLDLIAGHIAFYEAIKYLLAASLFSVDLVKRFRLGTLDFCKVLAWRIGGTFCLENWANLTPWVDCWGSRDTNGHQAAPTPGPMDTPQSLEPTEGVAP